MHLDASFTVHILHQEVSGERLESLNHPGRILVEFTKVYKSGKTIKFKG